MVLVDDGYVRVGGWIEIFTMLHVQTFAVDDSVGGHFVQRRILSVVVFAVGTVLLSVEAEYEVPASVLRDVRLALVQHIGMEEHRVSSAQIDVHVFECLKCCLCPVSLIFIPSV